MLIIMLIGICIGFAGGYWCARPPRRRWRVTQRVHDDFYEVCVQRGRRVCVVRTVDFRWGVERFQRELARAYTEARTKANSLCASE
jgi:hypothetical protein